MCLLNNGSIKYLISLFGGGRALTQEGYDKS